MWDMYFKFFPLSLQGGIPTALSRIKWWAIPLIGGGLAYTATVNTMSALRGKTDQLNYFYAGLATGAVIGKHCRSYCGSLGSSFFVIPRFIYDVERHS